MDARTNTTARSSGTMDRDVFKLGNSGATPPEEKSRPLATAVDAWEKSKMKKKRLVIKSDASGNAVSARPHDGDREPKRGMQQKLIAEARPRLNNAHGFRWDISSHSLFGSFFCLISLSHTHTHTLSTCCISLHDANNMVLIAIVYYINQFIRRLKFHHFFLTRILPSFSLAICCIESSVMFVKNKN